MSADSLSLLQELFRRQCTSLAQYMAESWPWLESNDREAGELVRAIQADERRWAERLAELIEQRSGVTGPCNYPVEFTGMHYLALHYLLDRLAQEIGQELPFLDAARGRSVSDPDLLSLVVQMMERKQGQLEALRRAAGPVGHSQPLSAG